MNRRQFCYLSLGAGAVVSSMAFGQSSSATQQYKVFIIHGYGATPQDHWFPWLKQQTSQYEISTVMIPFPNSEHPDFERWQQTLRDYVGMPDERCIFVAHSLGTISLLHYLSVMCPKRIGGMILVAGFAGRIPGLATINDFNIEAETEDGVLMALSSKDYPLYSVQFHPEAVLTEYGHEMIRNFLDLAKEWRDKNGNRS